MCDVSKPVAGFPAYSICPCGTIRGPKGRPLSPFPDEWGYPTVNVYKDGKRYKRKLHTLMLTTFVGPRPVGMLARHRDNDKNNGALSNLCWGTHEENIIDSHQALWETIGGTSCKPSTPPVTRGT